MSVLGCAGGAGRCALVGIGRCALVDAGLVGSVLWVGGAGERCGACCGRAGHEGPLAGRGPRKPKNSGDDSGLPTQRRPHRASPSPMVAAQSPGGRCRPAEWSHVPFRRAGHHRPWPTLLLFYGTCGADTPLSLELQICDFWLHAGVHRPGGRLHRESGLSTALSTGSVDNFGVGRGRPVHGPPCAAKWVVLRLRSRRALRIGSSSSKPSVSSKPAAPLEPSVPPEPPVPPGPSVPSKPAVPPESPRNPLSLRNPPGPSVPSKPAAPLEPSVPGTPCLAETFTEWAVVRQ